MRFTWWKIASIILLVYAVVGGFLLPVPEKPLLGETIRNLYFHVCMWFAMMILYTSSVNHAIKYLRKGDLQNDNKSSTYAAIGSFLGIFGLFHGGHLGNLHLGRPELSRLCIFGIHHAGTEINRCCHRSPHLCSLFYSARFHQ